MNYTKEEWTIASTAECGCIVKHQRYPAYNSYRIEYCPKHKAAPDMYEALREIVGNLVNPSDIEIGTKALAKAEGKLTT